MSSEEAEEQLDSIESENDRPTAQLRVLIIIARLLVELVKHADAKLP